ncbi:hypothetical protein DL346_11255 [Paenibacillus montanisoli]|uniref:Polymerase nucleotidyl transferase domain-containing protein n=2 Tax=Paenibacillus montanisoli TaxID=2081970 RepID=A0A328U9Z4_9BACL|nr:hypothetical protein DL346_11255 [Paenibacillus montanisoli]
MDVADALIDYMKTKYPDEIAVAAYYGSYAQGSATARSDLDFFFIPATSEGYRASLQFIVNDISFDFWPISWERAERMAAFEEQQTAIISDCKLLYVRSDEDYERFMKLRERVSDIRNPKHGKHFTERAETLISDAAVHVYEMSKPDRMDDLACIRLEAHGVMTTILQSLALLNQTYYTKGWGKNEEQISALPLKPKRLELLTRTIMVEQSAAAIRQACMELMSETIAIVLKQKASYAEAPSYPDRMKGFYEEVKGVLDKVKTACEMNDYPSAYYWAIGVQDEIARFLFFAEKGLWPSRLNRQEQELYLSHGFPNLTALLDARDLEPLFAAVEELDRKLEGHLLQREVTINRFATLEQFQAFLKEA